MTNLIKSYKFRMYPNKQQKEMFAKTFGCCRFVYNYYLDKSIIDYKSKGVSNSVYDNQKDLTQLKKQSEYSFLKEVDSQALNGSLEFLGRAYSNFFNKSGSYPRFKKKSHGQSYTTWVNNDASRLAISNTYIIIPKVGRVKLKQHRDIEGTIVSGTISKTATDKYFISITCKDVKQHLLSRVNIPVGIDVGIKSFAVLSDNNIVENPKLLDKSLRQLKKAQRKLSKKKRGSKNFEKQRIRVARKYEIVTCRRKDFLYKTSTMIIKNHDFIAVEDLAIKEMLKNSNSIMSRNISDVSWSEFIRQLEYKAQWYGRDFVKIDRYFASSQLCNVCGYKNIKIKNLSIRKWECPQCHTLHDRDMNASINILNEGLRLISS